MTASARAVVVVLVTLFVVACSQSASPTAPASSSIVASSPGSGATGALSSTTSSSVTFVDDSGVQGSEYVLSGFDGSLLTFNGSKGSFSATFSSDTTFRNAQLDKFYPTDPCREFANNYNIGGVSGDTGQLLVAINDLASNGCHARILVA